MVETGTANVINLSAAKAEVKDDNLVRVTLASSLTEDKEYTLTVNGMQDVSENKNTMTEGSSKAFTAIKDAVKPTLVSAVAKDANKIELTFSEELKSVSSAAVTATVKEYDEAGELGTAVANTVANHATDSNKLVVTITNSADYMENGAKYQVEVTGGSDVEGNAIDADQKLDVTGVADDAVPVVSSYSYEDGKLTITFSEEMDATELVEGDNYAVFETATGITKVVSTVVENDDADHTQAILSFTGLEAGKEYSLRMTGGLADGLKDASITPNPLANNTVIKFTTPVEVVDVTLDAASTAGLTDGKTVELTFNTELVKAEAENVANYTIVEDEDADKTLEVIKAVYDNSTKKVTLTTAAQNEVTYKVTVANLGNLDAENADATFAGVDKTKPVLNAVEVLGLQTIDLVFSEDLAADQTGLPTIAVVEKGTANVINVNAVDADSEHDNKLRVEFTAPLTAGKEYTISISGVTDKATPANASEATSKDFVAADDTTASTIANIVAKNAATVEIYFNEEVKENGTVDADSFEIKKGSEAVAWDTLNITFDTEDRTKVVLKNEDGSGNLKALFEDGTDYTVTVKDDDANYVSDVAGNKITETSYAFTGVKDTVKPQLVSAKMASDNDNKVILTFSEDLDSSVNKLDFTVTEASTGIGNTVTDAVVGTGEKANEVTLTLTNKTEVGKEYRAYVNNANSSVKDLAVSANLVDTDHAVALFDGVDKTAPTSATAKLTDENTVVLTFNEKLDATTVSKDDFAVTGNTVTAAEVDEDALEVTLTLGTAVSTGKTDLAIEFDTDQFVTDLAGNKMTALGITTNTDAAAPVLKDVKVTAIGEGTSTITLTFSEDVSAIATEVIDSEIATVPGYTVTDITAAGGSTDVVIEVSEDLDGVTPTVIITNTNDHITDGTNAYAGGDSEIADLYVAP